MADSLAVTLTGARVGDALSSFQHRTIRTVYVPRSVFSFDLTQAKGLALQDAGARGFLSAMGVPAVGASGTLALDWRVVTSANAGATLAQAIDVLQDTAAGVGARLVSLAVASSAGSVDRQTADRQAAAAGGAPRVPTVGGTLAGAAGSAGEAFGALAWWLVVFALLALAGLYLWTRR